MSLNRTYPQLTGTTPSASDQGFVRRRLNDIVGLAAILSTALVVSLVTGFDSPAFAVVLFAAIGGLAYGEQRMRDSVPAPQAKAGTLSWNS